MASITVSENMPNIILNGDDLYEDYGLVPKERPIIQPPKQITNIINVPGSVNGPIDMTYSINPNRQYEDVSGTLEFYADLSKWNYNWKTLYSALKYVCDSTINFHGASSLVLTEDPDWVFIGDVKVESITSSSNGSLPTVKLSYTFRPWQISRTGKTIGITNNRINLKDVFNTIEDPRHKSYANTAHITIYVGSNVQNQDYYGTLEYTTLDGRTNTILVEHGRIIIPNLIVRNDIDVYAKFKDRSSEGIESTFSLGLYRRRLYYV